MFAGKKGFEGNHAGAGEEQRGISRRYQGSAGHGQVALALKEFYIGISYLLPVLYIRLTISNNYSSDYGFRLGFEIVFLLFRSVNQITEIRVNVFP